ncbi:AraC family transcriptional regulator [Jeongeupia wiesaeckerbachi]|uniref:helix-turn-helix domain-containing protein n=1 Tax=Jeongeupia wiesaeckerbachi TaxID=3051218 RepID=UPI003D807C32
MRPQFEHIVVPAGQSWALLWREVPTLPFAWHYHPEFELTLTVNARGQRFIADRIDDFDDGDLVLLGPELPHSWSAVEKLDPAQPMLAVVVWFRSEWVEGLARQFPEYAAVVELAAAACRGLVFGRETAVAVRPLLMSLHDKTPAQRLPLLLDVLLQLAADTGVETLTAMAPPPTADRQRERLGRVLEHLHAQFASPIEVETLAEMAAMSVGAFHRFFKRHTQTTVTAYLTRLRIGYACQQLIQTDKAICVIADAAGYANLAHFNRQFRAAKGETPRDFRRRYRSSRASSS